MAAESPRLEHSEAAGLSFRAVVFAIVVSSLLAACERRSEERVPEEAASLAPIEGFASEVSYEGQVRPVLENRCVVCHGCYDAPCQLLLSSPEGTERGASKEVVYDSSRLLPMTPTRLGIDAHGSAEWRTKGFFSVLGTSGEEGAGEPLVLGMLALGAANRFPEGERLPASVGLDIQRELSCARPSEFDAYAREHPQGGMPYATAPLTDEELRTLVSFVKQRPPAPPPTPPTTSETEQVAAWESFLNGASREERIVARYLYEHWFLSHLHFEDAPAGPFFRIVRSRTPSGEPIDEIATVRPTDDPGPVFFYRLRRLDETIVRKTHIVLPLSRDRLETLRSRFLDGSWKATRLPGYQREEATNPFVAFDQLPARSRYEFLLEDARHLVMAFIRGPVCRGQVAVDVIEDHFFVMFLDPDHDLSVKDASFLERAKHLLDLPAEHGNAFLPGELWLEYNLKQRSYLKLRESFYRAGDPKRKGPSLDWIWDGDGRNRNALLTVFRNFDNADVLTGFVGGIPKTAWVMDYPIFERIYYDLVAGYDVFGNVLHQVSTRLYMDHLRMQAEEVFLSFLPADERERIRASWYVGATRQLDFFLFDRLHGIGIGTQVRYRGDDVVAELIEQVLVRTPAVSGPPDGLNRCTAPPCDAEGAGPVQIAVERELRRLASIRGAWVAFMPEASLLRLRAGSEGGDDLVYGLVHNDDHTNVAYMFNEEARRRPALDTLTLVRGHFGNYPNFFFEVEAEAIASFVDALLGVASPDAFAGFVERFGVRRTDARFWPTSDWLRTDLERRDPTEAGLYDLDRFGNF